MQQEPRFQMDKSDFDGSFGMRNDLILQRLIPHIPEETRHRLAEQKEKLFRELARGNISLLPGMEAFLQKVVAAKIPHIIASSAPVANLELFLSSTVLGKYFDHYLSAEEVAHGKPYPDVFIAAAERLGFTPNQCVVFEDAPSGIQAANAAGTFIVALETTHTRQSLSGYDLVYPSAYDLNLDEILHLFDIWQKENE